MNNGSDTLTLTRITKDMGTTIKPGPMVTAEPERTVTDAMLQDVGSDSGLNGPFLADVIVAMAVHENMGVNLYRALAVATLNPMLQTTYKSFEKDAMQSLAAHANLLDELGVPQYYISPTGRMTEAMDASLLASFLQAGSADPITIDTKTVEATMLASTMCVSNTLLLRKLADEATGDTQAAIISCVSKVEDGQRAHLDWAMATREKMAMAMIKHPMAEKMTKFAEGVIGKLTGAMP